MIKLENLKNFKIKKIKLSTLELKNKYFDYEIYTLSKKYNTISESLVIFNKDELKKIEPINIYIFEDSNIDHIHESLCFSHCLARNNIETIYNVISKNDPLKTLNLFNSMPFKRMFLYSENIEQILFIFEKWLTSNYIICMIEPFVFSLDIISKKSKIEYERYYINVWKKNFEYLKNIISINYDQKYLVKKLIDYFKRLKIEKIDLSPAAYISLYK